MDESPKWIAEKWTELITGYAVERQVAAREVLQSWEIRSVDERLLAPATVDACVGSVMLIEAAERLVKGGADEALIRKKLRDDPALWPAWCEIRGAALMLESMEPDTKIELEPDPLPGATRSPDFRFDMGGDEVDVEFKAIGLSAEDARTLRRFSKLLDIHPAKGIATAHVMPQSRFAAETLEDAQRLAEASGVDVAQFAPTRHLSGISGSVVSLSEREDAYLRRLTAVIPQHLRQLETGRSAWFGIYWTNGAPSSQLAQALTELDLPDNIRGIVLTGSSCLLGRQHIDNFVMLLPRGAKLDQDPKVTGDNPSVGRWMLSAVESSSGVRGTSIRVPMGDQRLEILRRDGVEPLSPFNMVLQIDPDDVPSRRLQVPILWTLSKVDRVWLRARQLLRSLLRG